MLFSVELLNLILYSAQQLGVALGLGAQTVMLVAYVSAMRDGVIDEEESQFLRATRNTLWVALVFIVLSGIAITALHALSGQAAIIMTPAYLFKLLLIALVILLTALLHTIPETFAEGLLGGTWYALFLVHILAPVTSWGNLLTLYTVWLVGFNLIWYVIVFAKRERVDKPVVRSSEAMVLQRSAPAPVTKKAERRPFFSFSLFKHEPEPAASVAPEVQPIVTPTVPPVIAPAAPPKAPVELPQIKLDPVPNIPPVVVPTQLTMTEMKVPVAEPAPPQKITTDAAPFKMRSSEPIERLPGSIATDTPFLPQVPPLQPIPIIISTSQMPAATPIPAAGVQKAAGEAPVLQKPEDLTVSAPELHPEIRLGLNVMPKSPDQIK